MGQVLREFTPVAGPSIRLHRVAWFKACTVNPGEKRGVGGGSARPNPAEPGVVQRAGWSSLMTAANTPASVLDLSPTPPIPSTTERTMLNGWLWNRSLSRSKTLK